MNNITVSMIKDMQHCIGFVDNRTTGTKNRVMHAYRNRFVDYKENENWNYLIELGLADRIVHGDDSGFVTFYVTKKGFDFLADLCGFAKIRVID